MSVSNKIKTSVYYSENVLLKLVHFGLCMIIGISYWFDAIN